MTKTPRFTPDELAELLQRAHQDVRRYRRMHPELQRAPAADPSKPTAPGTSQATAVDTPKT